MCGSPLHACLIVLLHKSVTNPEKSPALNCLVRKSCSPKFYEMIWLWPFCFFFNLFFSLFAFFFIRSTLTITPRWPSRPTCHTQQGALLKPLRWKSTAWWKRTATPGSCTVTFTCASPGGRVPEPPCSAEGHAPACSTRGGNQPSPQPGRGNIAKTLLGMDSQSSSR